MPDSDDYRVRHDHKVKLSKWPTDDTGQFESEDVAQAVIDKKRVQLQDLQHRLYAESKHAVLVIFQAMDAGGKDGAIKHVFSGVNPQGCYVSSFKAPSTLEKAHDFLWRHHIACPGKGMIGIHNRSHYEAVLVERVRGFVGKDIWKARFDQINAFESMLAAEGTTIIKFFLHISKEEQKKRFESRLKDESKHWKFNRADLDERQFWDQYQEAYEDLLERCSTKAAPWYVVPSDHKWFRNWVISDVLVRTLKDLKMEFPTAEAGLDKIRVK